MRIKDEMWLTVSFIFLFVPIFFIAHFYVLPAYAKRLHPEQYYQIKWCNAQKGELEVILADRTRVDCLTNTHAIEFDFGSKWAESLGQSLHYGLMTGKRSGIVLIMEKETDKRYVERIKRIIKYFNLPIDLWEISE